MEKKTFNEPTMKVVRFQNYDVICTSGDTPGSTTSDGTLGRGEAGGGNAPTPNGDGYIMID